MIPVKVAWGKESYEIEMNVADGVSGFKAQLQGLTNVPLDRMKIMPKTKGLWKGVLKDDFDLSSIDFSSVLAKTKPPIKVLLMGSASALVAPKTKTVFLEDLPPEEVAKVAADPSGLVNLGNTCYLNSVLQCLRRVTPLRSALQGWMPSSNGSSSSFGAPLNVQGTLVVRGLRDLYANLDRTANAVPPGNFVVAVKSAFPQFAQTNAQGHPMQQDAEEFYSSVLSVLATELSGMQHIRNGGLLGHDGANVKEDDKTALGGADNLIDAAFGIRMEETLTCDETPPKKAAPTTKESTTDGDDDGNKMDVEEETAAVAVASMEEEVPVVTHDLHRKLVCNIQGGSDGTATVNVTHINEGIQLSLDGKIEKHSSVLGRDALWTSRRRITRLPPVLVVQFGRFYWKTTPDSQDHAGVKCKVMKPVAFSDDLDVYEFCSDKVKAALSVYRERSKALEEERIAKKLKLKSANDDDQKTEADTSANTMEVDGNDEDDAELQAALKMSMEVDQDVQVPSPVGPGLPENFEGIYELFGVVTHKGRNADGGHYMGWVKADPITDNVPKGGKQKNEEVKDDDNWYVFDDDEVSPCKTEDVLKLKGGGDWHMSYLNFYRAKK